LICSEGGSAGKKIGITDRDICFAITICKEPWSGISPRFVFMCISPLFFNELVTNDRNYRCISINEFLNIPFPLPPEDEQNLIVAKIDELMILATNLKPSTQSAEAHENSSAIY